MQKQHMADADNAYTAERKDHHYYASGLKDAATLDHILEGAGDDELSKSFIEGKKP